MALRNQPYLPLYIQDFLTDEKLAECSASANGVYIRIMCLMHKSDDYGKILLNQKYKQTDNQIKNFASKFAKLLPYNLLEIEAALTELLAEKVLYLDDDFLCQKRMVRDGEISKKRSEAGKNGGNPNLTKSKKSNKKKGKNFGYPKSQTNTENETEYINEDINNNKGAEEKKSEPADDSVYKIRIVEKEKNSGEKEKVIWPFDSPEFIKAWQTWIDYRSERRFASYKPIGLQAALNDLAEQANGNEREAIEIIKFSISKNWQGLFANKSNTNNGQKYSIEKVREAIARKIG